MNKIKNIQLLIGMTAILLFTAGSSFAHFGTKGPYGGSVSCAAVNDSTVYIGTMTGGVFESTSSQLIKWRARPVGLKSGQVHALEHTGSYLFAVTGESGVYRFTGYVGNDRYWELKNTGLSGRNPRSLIALDSITLLLGTVDNGIFKTTNKGDSWTSVSGIDLANSTILGFAKASGRVFAMTTDGGVFVSDNGGDSWTDFNDVNTDGVANSSVISYNAMTDELLVVNSNGVFIAGSASTTSTPVFAPAATGAPSASTIRSVTNDGASWYMASGTGAYSSPAATVLWTAQNTGLGTTEVHVVQPFMNELLAGTFKSGIYTSPKSAVAWSSQNDGFNNLETYSMITQGDVLVVAATEYGVFVSKDLAASYTASNSGLTDSLQVNDLTIHGMHLLAATTTSGVFMSMDSGANWTAMNSGLSNMNIQKLIPAGSYVYLFNDANEIYRTDMTTGWTAMQTGLPSNVVPTSVTFAGSSVYLGTMGDGVFKAPESGGSWTSANTGLSNLNVTSLTYNGTRIFAGTDGNGVFSTQSWSINWAATAATSISHTTLIGLDGNKIQAMAYNAGWVYASYKGGLLASQDNGVTWEQGGNQFNLPSFTDVNKITFVSTRVFVTTENNCLYSNSLSELPPLAAEEFLVNSPESMIGIGPNPGNGDFTVFARDNEVRIGRIEVMDANGRLVTSADARGSEVHFSLDGANGVYFVRVETNKGYVTRRLVVGSR